MSGNRECNSIQSSIAAEYGLRGSVACPGITFESFVKANNIDRIGLLKVDIEGSEEHLFDFTSDDLLRKINQISVEFHDFVPGAISTKKVEQIIKRLGFLGFYCIPFSYMHPRKLYSDVLFIQRRASGISLSERGCFAALNALLELQRTKSQYLYQYSQCEIAPEVTGHGLPLSKCEAYNRVHDQHCGSS